jgi:hypothetical protein
LEETAKGELYNLNSSPSIITMIKSRDVMDRACSTKRTAYKILVEMPVETTRKTKMRVGA